MRTTERATVELPEASDTAAVRRRLMRAGKVRGTSAFEERGGRLQTLDVVGVVDIGMIVVEIAPKIDPESEWTDGASFLGHLLAWLGRDDPLAVASANVRDGETLFESALSWAIRTMDDLLEQGLPRRYAEVEERSTSIKGRIMFSTSARNRPGQTLAHSIRHAPLSTNNYLTAALLWIALEIGRRTTSIRTRASSNRLAQMLSEHVGGPAEAQAVANVELSRLENPWTPIIGFGRALAAGIAPDPSRAGRSASVAMLYTLKDLFEGAVRRVLRDGLPSAGLRAVRPRGRLLAPLSVSKPLIPYNPDFGVTSSSNGAPQIVGDAKWKRIVRATGQPVLSPSDAYQITSYVAATGAQSGFIVAPLPTGSAGGLVPFDYAIAGLNRPLRIIGVDLPTLVEPGHPGDTLRHQFCDAVASSMRISSRL